MVPLISINTLCFAPAPFDVLVASIARVGASAVFAEISDLEAAGVPKAVQTLSEAGVKLAGITHRAFAFAEPAAAIEQRARLRETIDVSSAMGAPPICLTTGGRGRLPWHEAAQRFCEAIGPCVEAANAAGVVLAIEPTSHLYADVSIVHRLMDAVTLARRAKLQIGLDLFPCWVDSDIEQAIIAAAPVCAFVQVSDHVLGDRGLPCRAIPGDGSIPLELLIGKILATGFRGAFDLEIIGPRLQSHDREAALRRGLLRVTAAISAAM